jgi:hypothetical protein
MLGVGVTVGVIVFMALEVKLGTGDSVMVCVGSGVKVLLTETGVDSFEVMAAVFTIFPFSIPK